MERTILRFPFLHVFFVSKSNLLDFYLIFPAHCLLRAYLHEISKPFSLGNVRNLFQNVFCGTVAFANNSRLLLNKLALLNNSWHHTSVRLFVLVLHFMRIRLINIAVSLQNQVSTLFWRKWPSWVDASLNLNPSSSTYIWKVRHYKYMPI